MKLLFKPLVLILVLASLWACASGWPVRLARTPEPEWSNRDRLKFLSDSPWVRRTSAPIEGWDGLVRVNLDLSATWVSQYFEQQRSAIAERMAADLPQIVAYDATAQTDRVLENGARLVAAPAPFEFDNRLLINTPAIAGGLGFWPTGAAAAHAAHARINIVSRATGELERELNGQTPFTDYIVIDLTITPVISQVSGMSRGQVRECVRRLLGQLLMRGVELSRIGAESRLPVRVMALGADYDDGWIRATASAVPDDGGGEHAARMDMLAPITVRLLFSRTMPGGFSWLPVDEPVIRLKFKAPQDTAAECASDAAGALTFSAQVMFPLGEMRRAGPFGV